MPLKDQSNKQHFEEEGQLVDSLVESCKRHVQFQNQAKQQIRNAVKDKAIYLRKQWTKIKCKQSKQITRQITACIFQ